MPESEAVLTRSKKTLLISKVILISIAARKKLSSCCSVSLVPQRFLLRIGAGSSYDAAYERSHLRARRMMRWCYEAGNGVRSKGVGAGLHAGLPAREASEAASRLFRQEGWSGPYMREYMRKVRARQKLERERDEAVNAAMARLSNPAPAAGLSVSDWLARSEAIMADMRLVLEEVKRRIPEVGENGPKPAQRL